MHFEKQNGYNLKKHIVFERILNSGLDFPIFTILYN